MLELIQKILAWRLFARREEVVSAWDIIKWWELRRIPYNLIVGATGLLPLIVFVALFILFGEAEWGGEHQAPTLPDPPIFLLFQMMSYGIAANIFYTCGWFAEIVVRKIWNERAGAFGEISFALGLVFSVLLTLVPSVLLSVVIALQWIFQ